MTYYEKKKEKLRAEAIEFQQDQINDCVSWIDVFEAKDYFYLQAKKYELVREFKENAII